MPGSEREKHADLLSQRVMRSGAAFGLAALVSASFGYVSSGAPFARNEGNVRRTPLVFTSFVSVDLVSGKDGLAARARSPSDRAPLTWTTADLVKRHAYDRALDSDFLDVSLGADRKILEEMVKERGAASLSALDLERTRVETSTGRRSLTREDLSRAALDAGRYLGRVQNADGRFAYFLDGTTGHAIEAPYSLARHAGATRFLVELYEATRDPYVRISVARAREALRRELHTCGNFGRCLEAPGGADAKVGTAALGALAFSGTLEEEGDAASDDEKARRDLLTFLRSSVRSDGSFSTAYDVAKGSFTGASELYTDGQAAFALALSDDPEARGLAERALAKGVANWSFFGARYYYGQEHWTCAAVNALARPTSPSPILRFCDAAFAFERRAQIEDGSLDDGAFGFPVPTPQIALAASRAEGWLATFEGHLRAGTPPPPDLQPALLRVLDYLARAQSLPEGALANAAHFRGGFPMSRVDMRFRIDVTQHAGAALLRASLLPAALFEPARSGDL